MSKKSVPAFCIVVDASVARASSPPGSTHPTGAACRAFLMECRGCGHRMVWNEQVKREWGKHQSRFSKEWLVSMFRMGKVRVVSDDVHDEFRVAIASTSVGQPEIAAMIKDAHLVEAAFLTDDRIAALDETVRGHFGRLSASFTPLRQVLWVNPTAADENPIGWLQHGAPDESHRHLTPPGTE